MLHNIWQLWSSCSYSGRSRLPTYHLHLTGVSPYKIFKCNPLFLNDDVPLSNIHGIFSARPLCVPLHWPTIIPVLLRRSWKLRSNSFKKRKHYFNHLHIAFLSLYINQVTWFLIFIVEIANMKAIWIRCHQLFLDLETIDRKGQGIP